MSKGVFNMPINWQSATKQEQKLLEGISILTAHREDLLRFLLDPLKPRLRQRPGILRDESWCFSHGEVLVIQAALDLWSGGGHLQIWECIEIWDNENWLRFLAAIGTIRGLDLQTAAALQSNGVRSMLPVLPAELKAMRNGCVDSRG